MYVTLNGQRYAINNAMDDYSICSDTAKKQTCNYEQPLSPNLGHSIKSKPTKQHRRINRDRIICNNVLRDDFVVYSTHDNVRTIVGMVRKVDNAIMYRKATNNGLGMWHVVQGYTKRLPEKVMRQIFDIKPYLGCYMIDMRQIHKVNRRDNDSVIAECGPHDRLPQTYIFEGKYPKHK